ncbi:FmdB family zinc ribbon protein [Breznakiellaceae bacterium SP9]
MKVFSGVRPPVIGEQDFFKCQDCGHQFRALIQVLPFLTKCPKCGSRNVSKDLRVQY